MTRVRLLYAVLLSTLAAAAAVPGTPLRAAPTVVTLALSGQPAPGYAVGNTYTTDRNTFSDPRAGEDGRVTFAANLTGPTLTTFNAGSSFLGTVSTNITPLLRGGDPVPGAPAGTLWNHPGNGMVEGVSTYTYPYALILPTSANGFVVTQSTTYLPFATPAYLSAIAVGQSGSLTTVGVPGTAAPGGTNLVYNGNTLQLAARSGSAYAFTADVRASTGNTSLGVNLFRGNGTAAPQFVAGVNQAAPGYAAGTTFLAFDAVSPSYRDRLLVGPAGQLATNAQLQTPTGGNDYGLFVAPAGGTLSPILKNGDVLPGTGGRTAVTTSGMSGLTGYNRAGSLFVNATYTTTNNAADAGLFRADAGGLTPVIVGQAQNAAGLPANTRAGLSFSASAARVNASEQVALRAGTFSVPGNSLTGSGYFVKPAGGGLVCLAYTGGPAPGGLTFNGLPGSFAQDDFGDVIFGAMLGGLGVTRDNDLAYFVWQNGTLSKLLGEGDALQVAPGDFRTIADGGLLLQNGVTFESTNLSPDGLFAFRAVFTDGTSGVFSLTVPEPSAVLLTLLGMSALGVTAFRRRIRGPGGEAPQ